MVHTRRQKAVPTLGRDGHFDVVHFIMTAEGYFSDAISMTKRYFTSLFARRS